MSGPYFNTTAEPGPTLARYQAKAQTQDERVLAFYRQRAGELLPPSKVWRETGMESEGVPFTSVRRAINTLTKAGHLVKTVTKRPGIYQRSELCWVYPRDNGGRAVAGGDLYI